MCDSTYRLVWDDVQRSAERTPWLSEDATESARMGLKATLNCILDNAREDGIIDDALELGLCRKAFKSAVSTREWIRDVWIPAQPGSASVPAKESTDGHDVGNSDAYGVHKSRPTTNVSAPTLFDLLKWKTDEQHTSTLKFRPIVLYKNHPLQAYC